MSGVPESPTTGCARIRDIVAAVIMAAVGQGGAKVYRARVLPLKPDAMPAILVYGYEENLAFDTLSAAVNQGTNHCQMVTAIKLEAADPISAEEALEALIGLVRSAILQSHHLLGERGAIERIVSVSTTRSVSVQGDDATGEATITFDMQWSEEYWLREDKITEIDVFISMFDKPLVEVGVSLVPATTP